MANHESWQQREKIINRVIALQAMGNDNSSPNEALIARKRARSLIMKHDISQSEINIVMGVPMDAPRSSPSKSKQPTNKTNRTTSTSKNTSDSSRKAAPKAKQKPQSVKPTDLEIQAYNLKIRRAKRLINVINNLSEFFIKILTIALIPSLLILFFKIKANGSYGYYADTATLLVYDSVTRQYLISSVVLVGLILLIVVIHSKLRRRIFNSINNK